ncbi:NAD-P-binding protein [Glonium stellatum]|uniref:NAD-P-binding protein n=1 Tax=Glonium stellatum TaxID=574774 RepID=A0A8E2EZ89_9PEZI|nr:NAD-P-binding protein [Glonium stellatum]
MVTQNTLPEDILQASYAYGSSPLSATSLSEPRQTFLFGYPIAHSMAPTLHATLFEGLKVPWTYRLLETPDTSLFLPALKDPACIGCAITMPHKVALISAVDDITDEGRMIGAINTVFQRKSSSGKLRYIGTNTDCVGVREAFLQNFPDILLESQGAPGLVIGGGGACRSAIYALWKWMGVRKIYLVNRLEEEVDAIINSFYNSGLNGELIYVGSVEQARQLEAPVIIVGTVLDFSPKEPGEILARELMEVFLTKEKKGYVLEMCYHPKPRTAFYELAEKAGWKVVPGTEPMIYQGVAQQVLWTETPLKRFDLAEANRAVKQGLRNH